MSIQYRCIAYNCCWHCSSLLHLKWWLSSGTYRNHSRHGQGCSSVYPRMLLRLTARKSKSVGIPYTTTESLLLLLADQDDTNATVSNTSDTASLPAVVRTGGKLHVTQFQLHLQALIQDQHPWMRPAHLRCILCNGVLISQWSGCMSCLKHSCLWSAFCDAYVSVLVTNADV
jgi:hypothetical protein